MVTIIFLAAFIIGYRVFLGFLFWLFKTSEIEKPASPYTTKSIKNYEADYEQIKALIDRAKSYEQIKALFDVIYSFRLRYRRFTRYGVDVDKTTEDLIKRIDERLTALNCNTPKNKLLTFFF